MSKANETNQTKPDYKIENCVTCPAELVCCSPPDGDSCIITTEKIEALVNGKR